MRGKGVALLFAYGAVLCLRAVAVAGGGHGTYTLLGIAGAPFSAFGIPFAIVAALLQWGIMAALWRRRDTTTWALVGFLVLHYVSAAFLLLLPASQYADWEYVRRVPELRTPCFLGSRGMWSDKRPSGYWSHDSVERHPRRDR
jgi:hypothetical protein